MTKSKSTLAVFAALIALGATTLDANARGQGGGMGGGQGSSQMGGQGKGQHGGQGMGQQQNAQGTGDMARERTRTRDMSQSGTPDMQQDMAQRRAVNQEQRQIRQTAPVDGATAAQ